MNAACSSNLSPSPNAARLPLTRNVVVVLLVVALHAGFIWALQSGLMRNTTELLVPAEVLAQFVDPPAPRAEPAAPAPPTPVARKSAVAKITPRPQKQPLAIADTTPSPSAPTSVVTLPGPAVPAPMAAAPDMPAGPPAAAVVQLPSSNADYLQNPKPPYPPLSARLGETGKVVYKVWIGPDGKALRAELVASSGFARLDNAAYETVMRWRYVPGARNGIAQTMPVNVPINWELRN